MRRARRWVGLLVGLAAAAATARAEAPAAPRFVDATPGSGIEVRNVCGAPAAEKDYLNETMGAGAAWLDYDLDGNLDLFVVNGSTHARKPGEGEPNRLFRGDGKGHFVDVTAQAGVGDRGWGYGVAVGDVDNDGDPDLFVTNLGPNKLFLNQGDGTFKDVTEGSGIRGSVWSSSAAFFDMDHDGDLDLYVDNYMVTDPDKVPRRGSEAARTASCTYKGIAVVCGPLGQVPVQDQLFRNEGGGRFSDVTHESGIELATPRFALGVVTGDYDNDGDTDVYVANDSVFNSLWQNDGDGKFTDVGLERLAALNADGRPQAGMGTDFGDYDGDGWLDIVVTNFSHDTNTIHRNLGGKMFLDDSITAGMGVSQMFLSWGTGLRDLDNDGDLDLFVANGHIYPQVDGYDMGTRYLQTNHLFVNEGGRFIDVSQRAGPGLALVNSFRAVAFGDYDNDGDLDLFVTTIDDAPVLLRNDTNPRGHWLQVELVGVRANRDAVGARVRVTAGGRTRMLERQGGGSYLSASSPILHFGLGAATRVERVEVTWPGGGTSTLEDVAADQRLKVRQAEPPAPSRPSRGSS